MATHLIQYATEYDFTILQNSDESLAFEVMNGASPYNLTGLTLTFYLKATNLTADGSGFSNTPSVTTATLGQFTVTIPRAQLASAGSMFYHIDETNGSLIDTLVFGTAYILPI